MEFKIGAIDDAAATDLIKEASKFVGVRMRIGTFVYFTDLDEYLKNHNDEININELKESKDPKIKLFFKCVKSALHYFKNTPEDKAIAFKLIGEFLQRIHKREISFVENPVNKHQTSNTPNTPKKRKPSKSVPHKIQNPEESDADVSVHFETDTPIYLYNGDKVALVTKENPKYQILATRIRSHTSQKELIIGVLLDGNRRGSIVAIYALDRPNGRGSIPANRTTEKIQQPTDIIIRR